MSDEELNELEHAARTSVAGGLAWRLGKALASVRAERDEQESEKNAEREALRAERDALRALLQEALAHLKTGQWNVPTDITLMDRIEAALNKGGE